ncbi:MAG: hypothetical protein FGF52_03905 [Candidatus Brockarchaeota archaeon]|nr:hypothetical protein [Candidatus Brockarchaeota archaeon]
MGRSLSSVLTLIILLGLSIFGLASSAWILKLLSAYGVEVELKLAFIGLLIFFLGIAAAKILSRD